MNRGGRNIIIKIQILICWRVILVGITEKKIIQWKYSKPEIGDTQWLMSEFNLKMYKLAFWNEKQYPYTYIFYTLSFHIETRIKTWLQIVHMVQLIEWWTLIFVSVTKSCKLQITAVLNIFVIVQMFACQFARCPIRVWLKFGTWYIMIYFKTKICLAT